MMKWLFLGLVFFCWFCAGPLFRVMAHRDYTVLQHGLREAKEDEIRSSMQGFQPPADDLY